MLALSYRVESLNHNDRSIHIATTHLECFAVGWVYKIDRQYQKVGQVSVLIYNVGFFIALFLGTVLAISLPVKPDDDTDAITTEANAVRIENS